VDYRDVLEEIELKGGVAVDPAVRFMIEACRKMSLSGQAQESLEVAARYMRSETSGDGLEAARVRCWQSIEGHDADLSDKRLATTRAVICTLYPRDRQDDLFETLDAFGEFALAAGVSSADLVEGLRRAFAV